MGTFFAEVQLASPARPDRREIVKLLVESGSMYTWVSATLLRDLGVQPTERRRILTIEGRIPAAVYSSMRAMQRRMCFR